MKIRCYNWYIKTTVRRIPAERLALGIIVIAGVIPLLAVAPGLGLVLKRIGFEKRLRDTRYVPNILYRLERKGFIRFEGKDDHRHVCITAQGRERFYARRTMLLHRPRKRAWDGYWRIVMFDIPQSQRRERDILRRELKTVGFKKLQGSVWISPDECEEYIKLLKADRRIGKRLVYLKTKDIEYSAALKKFFEIS